jgi:molecular chaperone DnaK
MDEKTGKPVAVKLGEKSFSPQELSAMILSRIKELAEAELGQPVTGAVITCPAYFKDPQRQATQEAAELAGLKVLRIFNEPTAAAYAYGLRHGNDAQEKLFVVYDLGGGTFDVTVIRMVAGSLEVIGTGGDPNLGGSDFDDRVVDWILENIAAANSEYAATLTDEKRSALRMRLKSFAEEGKKSLCDSKDQEPLYTFEIPQADVFKNRPIAFNASLSKAKFEELIQDLLDNSLKWIDEALKVPKEKYNYTEEHLTAVLLVGGSTRVPMVRKMLEKRFPKTAIWGRDHGINPDEIVALGASIVAAEEDPEGDVVAGTVLVDVTGHTLNVAVFDDELQRQVLAPIIPKETPIPCSFSHEFISQGRGQRQCRVQVYQGEGREIIPGQVTMIGEFVIEIAPIEAPTPLSIGLDLDANGILLAHATDRLSGQRADCKLNYSDSTRIPKEEMERKKAELARNLSAVLGQARNPLDGATLTPQSAWAPTTQPAANGAAAPFSAGVAQAASGFAPPLEGGAPPPPVPPAPPADAAAMMNPIMRALYTKAINSFGRVPPDRQNALMQLVMEIEGVAGTGDQAKLMSYFPQLSQLLDGVA